MLKTFICNTLKLMHDAFSTAYFCLQAQHASSLLLLSHTALAEDATAKEAVSVWLQ